MNLFGKAKKQQASAGPSAKDSIIRLRETLEMLEKREKFLQTKIENEVNLAKANVTKNKRGTLKKKKKLLGVCFSGFLIPSQNERNSDFDFVAALMALKRKKAYEGQIDKIMGARMTIETQVMTIENANVNLEAMNAMKSGAEAMKKIHGAMYAAIMSWVHIGVHFLLVGISIRWIIRWMIFENKWIWRMKFPMPFRSPSDLVLIWMRYMSVTHLYSLGFVLTQNITG